MRSARVIRPLACRNAIIPALAPAVEQTQALLGQQAFALPEHLAAEDLGQDWGGPFRVTG